MTNRVQPTLPPPHWLLRPAPSEPSALSFLHSGQLIPKYGSPRWRRSSQRGESQRRRLNSTTSWDRSPQSMLQRLETSYYSHSQTDALRLEAQGRPLNFACSSCYAPCNWAIGGHRNCCDVCSSCWGTAWLPRTESLCVICFYRDSQPM